MYRTDRGGRHRCSHLPRACGGIARRHHRLIARPRNARADRVEHRLQHSGERAGCEGRRDCSDGTVTALAAACYGSLAALWTLLIQLARLGVLVRLRRYRNVCGLLPGRLRRSRLRCRKRTRAVWSWDCTAVRIARRRSWFTASTRRRGWTARSLVKRLVLGGSYMRWSLRGRLPERSAKVHGPRVTVRSSWYGHAAGPTGRWRCRRPAPVDVPCARRAPGPDRLAVRRCLSDCRNAGYRLARTLRTVTETTLPRSRARAQESRAWGVTPVGEVVSITVLTGGRFYRLRVRFQSLRRGRSQMSFLGLSERLFML